MFADMYAGIQVSLRARRSQVPLVLDLQAIVSLWIWLLGLMLGLSGSTACDINDKEHFPPPFLKLLENN